MLMGVCRHWLALAQGASKSFFHFAAVDHGKLMVHWAKLQTTDDKHETTNTHNLTAAHLSNETSSRLLQQSCTLRRNAESAEMGGSLAPAGQRPRIIGSAFRAPQTESSSLAGLMAEKLQKPRLLSQQLQKHGSS
ncbi:unnamed protein product [Polarella glacialis]|uniref:Uncharacterized protein n=1 Tax=Polarella glacialis TaxID=89957 RepID=A0A813LG36_POLGL|nr:unnamed protein product [Polarella glacialis]